MGINSHYYTFYGVHVDHYDDGLSDSLYGENDLYKLLEDGTLPEDFGFIMDGMGGKYMVFGKILFDSGDLRYGDIKDVFVKIPVDKLEEYKKEYVRQFTKYFPDFAKYLEGEWQLMTFVHYS